MGKKINISSLGTPKNPFRSKPIPKGRIEWAIENSVSMKSAARLLGVNYNTFKKYAKLYDVFNPKPDRSGIPSTGNSGWNAGGAKLEDLLGGKHPNYPHWKLQERLIKEGYIKQCCSNCGYDEVRQQDYQGPYLLNFLDGDGKNHKLENLSLLCYNCFFLMKPAGKVLSTPKNIVHLRNKLMKAFDEDSD